MSVINQMLRDLDARESDGLPATTPEGASATRVTHGTVSVDMAIGTAGAAPRALHPRLAWYLGLVLVLGLAAALGWRLAARAPAPIQPSSVVGAAMSTPAVPVTVPSVARDVASPPPSEAVAAPQAAAAVVIAPPPRALPSSPSLSPAPAVPMVPAPIRVAVPERSANAVPAPVQAAATPQPIQAVAAPVPVDWSQPVREQLRQAQESWNAGVREPAAERLRETMAGLERTRPDLFGAGRQPVVVALLRELARMETALSRPEAALVLLRRHEALVNEVADLLALRGHAAQRVGDHAASAESYQAALRIRPGEPRWMLGAAVSLAGLGRIEAATQWAGQAAAVGPIDTSVQAYLRERGVGLPALP